MVTRGFAWTSLVIALFTVSALGCATSGTSKTVGPNDLASLAGRWTGSLLLPSGQNVHGTFDLAPNGDYVVQAGTFTARGKAQVKDGSLTLASTSTTGGLSTGPRTSIASLSETPEGTQILRGNGHSDAGPFSFDVSRKK
jgi:hypothetical protein